MTEESDNVDDDRTWVVCIRLESLIFSPASCIVGKERKRLFGPSLFIDKLSNAQYQQENFQDFSHCSPKTTCQYPTD